MKTLRRIQGLSSLSFIPFVTAGYMALAASLFWSVRPVDSTRSEVGPRDSADSFCLDEPPRPEETVYLGEQALECQCQWGDELTAAGPSKT